MLNLLNILSMLLVIYGMYYVLTSLTAFRKKQWIGKYEPKHKFKVLVACRNEEQVLASLIESINNQNYPKDMYELCVIPNNCTDNTKAIALALGARIIDCVGEIKCKGDALRYAFDVLSTEDFDAYVVFDADNVVHPNFLSRMNDACSENYKVAQGYRDSKNPQDNWISGSYSIYYWMQNFFFNRARMNAKGSASINGTGFMVKKEVIDSLGFDTVTLTEDIEFTAKCAINNIQIAFVQDAITYDEQPVSFSASWKQRKRWSIGAHNCLKIYGLKLIESFVKNRNMLSLDMLLNFMSPLMQVFGTVIMIIMLALKIAVKMELETLTALSLVQITGMHLGAITYIANILLNVFLVKYNKRKITSMLSGIFLYTFFIVTWIPINFVSIFSKDSKWEQITHTRCVRIYDIVKE